MTGLAADARVAVLDIGKTNVKVVLFDGAGGQEAWTRTMPNTVQQDGPYPHFDVPRIQSFILDSLADLVRSEGSFDAVSITAHGASGALIGPDGLALPVLDYEFNGPDSLQADYDALRPPFAETFSPRLPGGLNLGAQLYWQSRCFPDAFARATIVTYPQYWAWWLTGVAAAEPTSLGTHTDLWAPAGNCLSSMVGRLGWTGQIAPVRSAFDALGPIRPALAERIGLSRPVPVACGIHDSNASLLPHLQTQAEAFSVVSTGTWAIVFAIGGTLDRLDAARDTLANVDAYRRPVPSARFMGGREFDLLTDGHATAFDAATVEAVLQRQIMALPSFAQGSGPFPHRTGGWSHDPATLSGAERTVAASLYVALMTASCLAILAARGKTIIEGPFARNALYCSVLARITGREVLAARGSTGTSAGAARLMLPAGAAPEMIPAMPIEASMALAAYCERWHRECGTGA